MAADYTLTVKYRRVNSSPNRYKNWGAEAPQFDSLCSNLRTDLFMNDQPLRLYQQP